MALINIYFVWLMIPLALILTFFTFYYRGMWWWSIIAGLIWVMFGFGSISMPEEVFVYQRTLAIVFIVVGIGVLFSPLWYKKKEDRTGAEKLEEDDVGAYRKELQEFDDEIGAYRKLGRRKRPL